MPLKLFKAAEEKADIEFAHAYEKGVNLGPEKWQVASRSFGDAAKHYLEAGNDQKYREAFSLSHLFYALTVRSCDSWLQCHNAMSQVGDITLNVGFSARSADIQKQSKVMADEISVMNQLNRRSAEPHRVAQLRSLAREYLELIGNDLVIWKLLKVAIDPQKRAYYLLGLASLVEANSISNTDPERSVSLLSDAITQLDLAGEDPLKVRQDAQSQIQNLTKIAKCWFCGREVQGFSYHYVTLQAEISGYLKGRYANESPVSMEGERVIACKGCYSAVRFVSDAVAQIYFMKAMQEIKLLRDHVEREISQLESRISHLESRVRSLPAR